MAIRTTSRTNDYTRFSGEEKSSRDKNARHSWRMNRVRHYSALEPASLTYIIQLVNAFLQTAGLLQVLVNAKQPQSRSRILDTVVRVLLNAAVQHVSRQEPQAQFAATRQREQVHRVYDLRGRDKDVDHLE